MIRKILAVLIAIFMQSPITYADENSSTDSNASVVVKDRIDNSNLPVKVVKEVNGQYTTIYTGLLSGYDNGKWTGYDLADLDVLLVLQWSTMENEGIYIYPNRTTTETNREEINTIDINLENTDEEFLIDDEVTITQTAEDVSFDARCKKSGQTFFAEYSIRNNSSDTEAVQAIATVYKNNVMQSVALANKSIVGWSEWNPVLNLPLPENMAGVSYKLMVWNTSSQKPYCSAISVIDGAGIIKNEIFTNIPVEIYKNTKYLFRPKRNGTYSFSNNVTVYENADNDFIALSPNTVLRYPNNYYIESSVEEEITAQLVTSDVLPIHPYFGVSEGTVTYYTAWSMGGKIYKEENDEHTLVCNDRASWLRIKDGYIYYRNLLDGGRLYRVDKTAQNAASGEVIQE